MKITFFSVLLADKMHSIVRFREKFQEKLDSSYSEPPEAGSKIFNGTTFINANTSRTARAFKEYFSVEVMEKV